MKHSIAASLLVLAACSSAPKKTTEVPDDDVGDTGDGAQVSAGGAVTADAVCDKIMALKQQGCAFLSTYDLDRAGCIEDYNQSLADSAQETDAVGRCFVDAASCDDVTTCVDKVIAASMEGGGGAGGDVPDNMKPLRTCDDKEGFGAVGYPRAEWNQRRGALARKFSDVPSSQKEPIEVCGVEGEINWLLSMTCNDGSNPWAKASDAWDAAHKSRTGSSGSGGRCDAIIDEYVAPCPEKQYTIYMDMYVCPMD
jgi:hypothetical protein